MEYSEIMVSVQCITFNHVQLIRETLEGFLMQKTSFAYEILIHDDASTDGTTEILREYEKKYPNQIRVVYEEENKWGKGFEYNHDILLPLAKGKYIALCEGDDAWIDDRKLQLQVDYMEEHPECSLTLHKAYLQYPIGYSGKRMPRAMGYEKDGILAFEEIFSDWKAPTSSFLFRRNLYEKEPKFFRKAPTGDESLMYYMATEGEIYYFDRVMSVYNRMTPGSWTSSFRIADKKMEEQQTKLLSGYVNFLEEINAYFEYTKCDMINSFIKDKIVGMFNYIILVYDTYDEMRERAQQFRIACHKKWWDYIEERTEGLWFWNYTCLQKKLGEKVRDKKIYIYGAGILGCKLAAYCREHNILLEGFLVSNASRIETTCMELPVYSVDILEKEEQEFYVIIAVTKDYAQEIADELKNREIAEYIWPFATLYDAKV